MEKMEVENRKRFSLKAKPGQDKGVIQLGKSLEFLPNLFSTDHTAKGHHQLSKKNLVIWFPYMLRFLASCPTGLVDNCYPLWQRHLALSD